MKHLITFIIVLMLAMTACSLGSNSANDDIAVNTITVNTAVSTQRPQSTNTPQPTVTTSTGNNNTGGNPLPCTPQTNWVRYTVVSGDTLSSIAISVNSTIDQLASANCLTNINTIAVGQQLYVPRLPIVPTNTPTSGGASNPQILVQGGVGITQVLAGDAGMTSVLAEATATLTWDNPPSLANATMVQFMLMPTANQFTGGTPLGTDTNLGNGISVQWVIPANVNGFLMAFAYQNEVTLLARTEFPTNVFSGPGAGARCVITMNQDIAYYDEPFGQTSAGVFVTGTSFQVLGRHLSGWYAVHPSNSGVGGVDSLLWIPVDAPVRTSSQNC